MCILHFVDSHFFNVIMSIFFTFWCIINFSFATTMPLSSFQTLSCKVHSMHVYSHASNSSTLFFTSLKLKAFLFITFPIVSRFTKSPQLCPSSLVYAQCKLTRCKRGMNIISSLIAIVLSGCLGKECARSQIRKNRMQRRLCVSCSKKRFFFFVFQNKILVVFLCACVLVWR